MGLAGCAGWKRVCLCYSFAGLLSPSGGSSFLKSSLLLTPWSPPPGLSRMHRDMYPHSTGHAEVERMPYTFTSQGLKGRAVVLFISPPHAAHP